MKKTSFGFYLIALSTVLAIVGLVLYKNALVKTGQVNTFLILAIVAGACACVAAIALGKEIANVLAAAHVILLMAAVAVSIGPMVNDIGLAYAGLNQWSAITPYFHFVAVGCVGWLLSLIASFAGIVKKA